MAQSQARVQRKPVRSGVQRRERSRRELVTDRREVREDVRAVWFPEDE